MLCYAANKAPLILGSHLVQKIQKGGGGVRIGLPSGVVVLTWNYWGEDLNVPVGEAGIWAGVQIVLP